MLKDLGSAFCCLMLTLQLGIGVWGGSWQACGRQPDGLTSTQNWYHLMGAAGNLRSATWMRSSWQACGRLAWGAAGKPQSLSSMSGCVGSKQLASLRSAAWPLP